MLAGKCEKYAALLTEIIILSVFFLNHCHSYIAVHFLEMFLLLVYMYFNFYFKRC